MEFKQWFEDNSIRKVWHTYGYDRHVLNNEGTYVPIVSPFLVSSTNLFIYSVTH
jgi:hypothetical protein